MVPLKYRRTLRELWRRFAPEGFTIRDAIYVLGYQTGFEPEEVEKARQHAKSDILRLYRMGLLNRQRCRDSGGPGRPPHMYWISSKGEGYLEWLRREEVPKGFNLAPERTRSSPSRETDFLSHMQERWVESQAQNISFASALGKIVESIMEDKELPDIETLFLEELARW